MAKPGHHQAPRRGSAPFTALSRLHRMGDAARVPAWITAIGYACPPKQFQANVIDRLVRDALVVVNGDFITVTKTGLHLLGVAVNAGPVGVPAIVGPAYRPEPRSLNVRRHCAAFDPRPGSLDYRAIPSLIGRDRVPFASSLPVA
ncbi:hypothetical protein AAKU55_004928 [Oxalobacteraceae bacterium GrIS 1.11]